MEQKKINTALNLLHLEVVWYMYIIKININNELEFSWKSIKNKRETLI